MKKFALHLAFAALLAAPAFADGESVPGLDINGQCVGDANGNSAVAINELITAVNNALDGCPRRPITLQLKAQVGDLPFACGSTYSDIGTAASQFIPSDLRFYLSDIVLVTPEGDEVPLELEQDGVWQHENLALLDFEDGTGPCSNGSTGLNTTVRGSVPSGVYTGIEFTLGVPFELNHINASTAPAPLNVTEMFWSWNSGYKFIKVDTADDKFRVHLGSTGCNGASSTQPPTSCDRPNRPRIHFDAFNPEHQAIVADLARLLADSNLDFNTPQTPPGCMASPTDPECAPLFPNLGLVFADGSLDDHSQTLFRVAAAEDDHDPHSLIELGSAADGAGQLTGKLDFDGTQELPLADCVGGTGDECEGGTRLFSDTNPGFLPIAEDDAEHPIFTLPDGVPVTLEIVAIADALSLRVGEATLDSPGQTLSLGSTPEIHTHPEYLLAIPGGGGPAGEYELTVRLTTNAAPFTTSDDITITFVPTEAHN